MNKSAKAQATRAAKSKRFASQIITVTDDWRIVRADELNWEIQRKGKFFGYYGTLIAAFKALPAKILGDGAYNTVADVIRCQEAILARIDVAMSGAKA